MQNQTGYGRHELRKAYVDLCGTMEPNVFVTLATNRSASKETITRLVKDYCARIDRKLLGHTWTTVTPSERTDGIFFVEHVESNIHVHGMVRVPGGKDITTLSQQIWAKLCPSGSVVVRAVDDLEGCAYYCTKEMRDARYGDDQIILTRVFMAA